ELIVANPSAEQLLNYPLRKHLGKNLLRSIARARREKNYPASFKPLFKEIHAMLNDMGRGERTRRTFQIEGANGPRDVEGTILPVGSTGSAMPTQGIGPGRLVVLRDVSEEKSVERFREELTHMIVHDLRSPLSGVIS